MQGDGMRIVFEEVVKENGMELDRFEVLHSVRFLFRFALSTDGESCRLGVSDFIEAAPECVLRDYAQSLCLRLKGDKLELNTERVKEYVRSDDFITAARGKYLSRCRNITRTQRGQVYDLQESMKRVVAMGLVRPAPLLYLTWAKKPSRVWFGWHQPMMRTVCISPLLDNERVPLECLDQIMFHELLHLGRGPRRQPRH